MRRWIIAAALAGLLLPGTGRAAAGWTTGGDGAAAATAYVMPAGHTPSGTVRSTTVGLSWSAATLPGGPAVAGYVIHRYDPAGAAATVGGTCAGVVVSTSCTETVTPGTWTYTDTPVQLSWTGPPSPPSPPITVLPG